MKRIRIALAVTAVLLGANTVTAESDVNITVFADGEERPPSEAPIFDAPFKLREPDPFPEGGGVDPASEFVTEPVVRLRGVTNALRVAVVMPYGYHNLHVGLCTQYPPGSEYSQSLFTLPLSDETETRELLRSKRSVLTWTRDGITIALHVEDLSFRSIADPDRDVCSSLSGRVRISRSSIPSALDSQVSAAAQRSVVEQLRSLKQLFDEGILTEEEYQSKRRRLVERLHMIE